MSAYYTQHNASASPSRIRQEGFNVATNSPSLNAPPSPTTPFDSQNVFFAGSHNVFPNAFKKFNDRNAMDFSDTLASIMSSDSADDPHRPGAPATFRHSLDYPSASASSATTSHSQSASSHFFDIPSFPPHLNNLRGANTADTPSSLTAVPDPNTPGLTHPHPTTGSLGHNFLADPQLAFHHAHHPSNPGPQRRHRASFSAAGPPPVLPRLNTMRTASPSTGSPSDINAVVPSSPFSPGAVGVLPSSGAVRSTSRSRSRSRPATGATTGPGGVIERNPSVNARSSRVAKKRTTSISSPSPVGTPGSIANGAVVQSVQQQSSQQPQQPQPLAMSIIIPDPTSAHIHNNNNNVATASPATTAASWVFSPSSTAFSLPNGESTAATSFNNTFAAGGQSLPMGGVYMDDDKTPPTKEDTSTKQAALLNEKRRRRRESHNAVERRRRDNINEKINELATLIPECLLLEANNNAGLSPGAAAGHEDGAGDRPPHGLDGDLAIANSGQGAAAAGSGDDDQAQTAAHSAMKANKGVILRKSVDYIRYLQQLVQAQSEKNHDLEMQLAQYRNDQPSGQGHQSMPSQSSAEEFSSSPGPSNPSGSGHGNMMFLPSNDGSNSVDAFGNPTDFAPFDFSRFTQPNGDLNHNHLVSVKEEDPSGIMDMNVLSDEHQLPQPHHQFVHNGYEHHPQFDLASLPPYHLQNGFIPSSSHQQQQLPSQAHQHQQQHTHQPVMEPSPSGSGSNVSDLEDVEEEDESAERGIVDNNSNNSQPRGRKELRDAQPGRFSHSSSVSLGGGRNASSRSASNDHRARMSFGPGPGTPSRGDAMHVDERP